MRRTWIGVAAVGGICAVAITTPAYPQPTIEGAITIGVVLPETSEDAAFKNVVIDAAEQGLTMAEEEFALNAEMFEITFEVETARAAEGDSAMVAADLVNNEDAFAIVGGYDNPQAEALSAWSAQSGVPFLNVGASSDALRNDLCQARSFHVAPSAAMYLDAMAGWYVRAEFRDWYIVQADDAQSAAQYERLSWTLNERFFGASETGHAVVAPGGPLPSDVVEEISGSQSDFVLLLVGPEQQLEAMRALQEADVEATVTGFPYPETQTRAYFDAVVDAAPDLSPAFRATGWEATLDAYGARELNARYRQRFDAPMEPSAWASFQAVKILYEAVFFGGSTEPQSVSEYIFADTTVFDIWKGIGTSFRPWDGQLRQSVYLIEIDPAAQEAFNQALLVGELPAIYMPGTEPLERLDQLGDLQARSTCSR